MMQPGIYFGMPESEYFAAEGLSCSGMKHLTVSPLHYWHKNINPAREPEESTYPQLIGKATHCRILEPERYADAYAVALSPDDFPGCLVTDDDMKQWLTERCLPTTGKKKQDRIDRIMATDSPPPIWDVVKAENKQEGKTLLKRSDFDLVNSMAEVVESDPYASQVLKQGIAEVSFFVRDPVTGAMLKARMDYVRPTSTIDLKTFTNSRGKPTDRAVFDAIYHEGYYHQAVIYHTIREMARQGLKDGTLRTYGFVEEEWVKEFTDCESHTFGFVFVEAAEPFDLRVVQLKPHGGGEMNVYWQAGKMRMEELTARFAEYGSKYGEDPWREPLPPHVLEDADIPQLVFSGGW